MERIRKWITVNEIDVECVYDTNSSEYTTIIMDDTGVETIQHMPKVVLNKKINSLVSNIEKIESQLRNFNIELDFCRDLYKLQDVEKDNDDNEVGT